jgi:hypothetical protein
VEAVVDILKESRRNTEAAVVEGEGAEVLHHLGPAVLALGPAQDRPQTLRDLRAG